MYRCIVKSRCGDKTFFSRSPLKSWLAARDFIEAHLLREFSIAQYKGHKRLWEHSMYKHAILIDQTPDDVYSWANWYIWTVFARWVGTFTHGGYCCYERIDSVVARSLARSTDQLLWYAKMTNEELAA